MPTDKVLANFRLSEQARGLLEQMAIRNGVTQTTLLEMIIREASRRGPADSGQPEAPPRSENRSGGRSLPRKAQPANTLRTISDLGGHQRRILLHLLRVARLQEAPQKGQPSRSDIRWSAGSIYPELGEVTRSLSAALSRAARRLEESGLIRPAVCSSLGEVGPSITKYSLTATGRHLAESVEEITNRT